VACSHYALAGPPTLQGPSFDCPIPFPYSSLKRRGTTGLELHGGEQDGGLTERWWYCS